MGLGLGSGFCPHIPSHRINNWVPIFSSGWFISMTEQTKMKEKEKKKKATTRSSVAKSSTAENATQSISISATQAFLVHLICGLGLAITLWVAHNLYSINLVSDPSPTLLLTWVLLYLPLFVFHFFFIKIFVLTLCIILLLSMFFRLLSVQLWFLFTVFFDWILNKTRYYPFSLSFLYSFPSWVNWFLFILVVLWDVMLCYSTWKQ